MEEAKDPTLFLDRTVHTGSICHPQTSSAAQFAARFQTGVPRFPPHLNVYDKYPTYRFAAKQTRCSSHQETRRETNFLLPHQTSNAGLNREGIRSAKHPRRFRPNRSHFARAVLRGGERLLSFRRVKGRSRGFSRAHQSARQVYLCDQPTSADSQNRWEWPYRTSGRRYRKPRTR